MHAGDVLIERYELLAKIGEGGMGVVFRAWDRVGQRHVALKLLKEFGDRNVERFEREAALLGELQHPHIVRFVDYGRSPSGEIFLAMEWLTGETLADLLARRRLTPAESLEIGLRLSSGLSLAHSRGVVHRDLKPGNILIEDDDLTRVKILDFGIARQHGQETQLTRTGTVLGTAGYMAPEQARGESQVSYAVDVFALGCVLFECVTGRPAFQGQHVMAILAKLLLEDPPPPVALVPEMSAGLSALIERMLRKEPEDRPPDAGKVWQELSELSAQEPCVATAASPGVSTAERRIFSVVAIASSYATTTLGTTTTRDASAPDHTLIGVVRHAVAPLGGRLHVLLDGTILISITDGHPQDQAQRAARCAIWTRETACSLALALVTGWGEAGAESPVGELLDRAAAILAAAPPLGHRPERGLILLDATSRELLESNFEIAEEDGCIVLRDEHRLGEVSPMLLGRATPFVGRQRELRNIVDIVVEAIEEKEPTIVLVSGEAGLGKSRVRRELIMALRRSEVEPQILTGRGDLMTRGSAFATIGSIFHDALELGAGGPVESQREKIEFIVNLFAPPEHRRRVTEFLGEILRVHFPDSESPQLRAARQNPQLMADQVARAYVDFVRGFAATRPSAIILDDLHWADAPSLQLIEAAIAALCEDRVAYVVVAFARPELDERFPRLWAKLRLHRVHLTPLSRRATTELAREVLGDTASDEAIQGMVERAGGNPLFLEELLRGHAGGRSDAASATVLGMFDRRVAALPNELRRFLRAASVFGEAFWLAGVRTLLGGPAEPDESGAWIALLLRDELIVRRASRRFTSVPEYGFRHSLLRDGVYATLTDKDRVTAHRLAGQWLRDNGESDPAVLGHHFDLGGEADEAASYYARAAEQALAASDYTACLRLAERGLALGPVRGPVADLWALVADAAFWSRDPERAMQAAGSAMAISRPGSRSDCRALGDMLAAGLFHRGSASEPRRWLDRLLATEPDPDAASTLAWGFDAAMLYRVCVEPNDELTSHVRRLEAIVATADADDPLVAAWLANVRASWHRAQGRPWAALRSARSAAEGFERAGYRRYLPYSYAFVGIDLVLVGDFVGGDAELRRSAALAQVGSVQAFVASHFAATSALWQGRSARTHELTASSQQSASGKESLPRLLAALIRADAWIVDGALAEAEASLAEVEASAASFPFQATWFHATRARLCLAQGRLDEAARALARARALHREIGRWHFAKRSAVDLTEAELLLALGEPARARHLATAARKRLLDEASQLDDAGHRHSYLHRVPDHAGLLALAAG